VCHARPHVDTLAKPINAPLISLLILLIAINSMSTAAMMSTLRPIAKVRVKQCTFCACYGACNSMRAFRRGPQHGALGSRVASNHAKGESSLATCTARHATPDPSSPMCLLQAVKGSKQMEGAGVQITRTIGTPSLRNLDPFLMLDELKLPSSQAFAGFPDHPHRGFETCSVSARKRH
jgi:hypothetical protein